jgi:transposase
MAMVTRKHREKQEDIWVPYVEIASAPGHPFYERLGELLDAEQFDTFVERLCVNFYSARYGRPSLTPGIYFRSLLIGYFEGIGSERGIAWRLADSLGLRRFLGIWTERIDAGPFDDLARSPPDRPRHPSQGVHVGAGCVG